MKDHSTVMSNRIIDNARNIKNFICLLLKQYIYRKRCFKEKPTFQEFKQIVWQTKNIENFIAVKNNQLAKHVKKWKADQAKL